MSCCLFSACLSEGAWQAQTPELDLSHGRGAGGNKHVWSTNQPQKKHISTTKKTQICAQPKHLQTSFRPHSDLTSTTFGPQTSFKAHLKLFQSSFKALFDLISSSLPTTELDSGVFFPHSHGVWGKEHQCLLGVVFLKGLSSREGAGLGRGTGSSACRQFRVQPKRRSLSLSCNVYMGPKLTIPDACDILVRTLSLVNPVFRKIFVVFDKPLWSVEAPKCNSKQKVVSETL